MVAIFGGKWWLLVVRKNGGVGGSHFGTVLRAHNTETNVFKMEYDEFLLFKK